MICHFDPTGETKHGNKHGNKYRYQCIYCHRYVWSHVGPDDISRICTVDEPDMTDTLNHAGVGTEIHKLIMKYGYDIPSGDCKCNARIRAMNTRGVAWCEDNVNRILRWLQESAKRYKIDTYVFAENTRTLAIWKHCVKMQIIYPAIECAKLNPKSVP